MAAGYLRRERAGHTLQPTALVHETFVRLVDQARGRGAQKRGGLFRRVEMEAVTIAADNHSFLRNRQVEVLRVFVSAPWKPSGPCRRRG